ncbi:hypothetical protein WJX81_004654 [Elliptochloris bilobata]|uniref:ZC3H15/TMA46 family C-terminal domain-containing protein n=1 Tax=Elliptochloris bilobata TaxID=381761 RepID=A0AAW1S6N3_9CHLO
MKGQLAVQRDRQSCQVMPGAAPEATAPAPDKQPLTAEQFSAWKQHRDAQAAQDKAVAAEQRRADILAGKVAPNGRELYELHPELFEDY